LKPIIIAGKSYTWYAGVEQVYDLPEEDIEA